MNIYDFIGMIICHFWGHNEVELGERHTLCLRCGLQTIITLNGE